MFGFFMILETVAFLLPAIPQSLTTRLGILGLYAIAHFSGVQKRYLAWKLRAH